MNSNFTLIRAVNFKEAPMVSYDQKPLDQETNRNQTSSRQDFFWINTLELRIYCERLLTTFTQVATEDVETFINNLLEQAIQPIIWLNNFEELLNLNLQFLWDQISTVKLTRTRLFIVEKRKELKALLYHSEGLNIRCQNGTYSFKKVKFHLSKIEKYCEKRLFLTQCKFEYLQYKPSLVSLNTTPFDEKIDLEIQRLIAEEEYLNFQKQYQQESALPSIQKIKINSQLNQFADLIYQMINEIKVNDLPLIETSNSNIAKLVASFFTDSNGSSIEQSTIRTYLQKNKPEKRPKEYNRIRFT